MLVERLSLTDFRNYASAELELTDGITAVIGDNGQGKTNIAEALAYLATLESFRGAPPDALIRIGAAQAVVRATIRHGDGREVLIEAEINRSGRNRVLVNKQRLHRARDLLGVLRVTVFAPDDLELVKGGPGERRRYLDDLLVALQPKHDQLRVDLDRILRQRNTLLKQAGGRLTEDIAFTLDVWDSKLATVGDALGAARHSLVEELRPLVAAAYSDLAGSDTSLGLTYDPPWRAGGLAAALADARRDEVRRQISLVGPHRDDVALTIEGRPARTHASQGEQRTLALGLRLAGHRLVTTRHDAAPLLVLDDVLSELDPHRSDALLRHLPEGQVILTTAGVLPDAAHPRRILRIMAGTVTT
ncbi:MAG: DNA replication/repair protein RecF [Acidimicrobiia bacterium]